MLVAVQMHRLIVHLTLTLLLPASSPDWLLTPAAAFMLPGCQLINQTVSLEKEGCPICHSVETTICSGHCRTKEPNIKVPLYKMPSFQSPFNVFQQVCTYEHVHYKTFELPDCPPGVDPTITYPVALSCHCGLCDMKKADCTVESLRPDICMNDVLFNY
ncbi:luteinizing hormone subunit beta precursor [Cynoglossus semilaevis]|uniref:Gonadotropin subunit beta-2 n=1 Tax=Cynoglossus semilaevis TaxID=244447 RepID=H9NID3_CYNSE|nr:luteinizing hormone subunit beta precursor [Cynoglossus semilaevis]AFF59207.1 luteinizing hormone beta subunit [Cynoglossus semilaevis]